MSKTKVEALVVGGGQAGLAVSKHLNSYGIDHVVLERGRIAERWRSVRWDSLVANGPAWHDRFPELEFDADPESFVPKEAVADYFVDYAEKMNIPIKTGVEVLEVKPRAGDFGFDVETSDGAYEADYVISATGAFQTPTIPPIVDDRQDFHQIHSAHYKNPDQLPEGAVLVVGAGSSGAQIAEELLQSGREVYLSVGPHDRPPRRYRGRDFVWWLGVLNLWDAETSPGKEHTTIAVSGANGGNTVDFRHFAERGMTLLGRTMSYENGVLKIADDLASNIRNGDENLLELLKEADAFVERTGIDLPEEPEAHIIGADPECVTKPIRELNLKEAGIKSIVWATGFDADYSWLNVEATDEKGHPKHQRGVAHVPGIYFIGLPWQTRRGSTFIWGVWHDAKYIADHIAKQRSYLAYEAPELN